MFKKILAAIALLTGSLFAQVTPLTGLNRPTHGTLNWDVQVNQNWDKLDGYLGGSTSLPNGLIMQGRIVTGNVGGAGNSDHITGVLASSASSQSIAGEVVFSATVVYTPNALNPTIPFAAGYDEFIACGLGASNSVAVTNIAACIGFSGNVISTASFGKTANIIDMVNFVANKNLKQGVGTINVTNNDGFWSADLGGGANNGYPFRCDDQTPSAVNSYCFYSAGRGIWHASDVFQSNGQQHAIVAKTTTYLATKNDEVILADATGGPFTITLPVAANVIGAEFTIKKADVSSNLVTVSSNGSFIDVGATYTGLNALNNFLTVVSNGAGYYIKATQSGIPAGIASGSTLVSSGVSAPPVYQLKPVIDIRDVAGVDCTGVTDSSSALNTLFTSINQKEIDFPASCQLRVDTQLTIFGQTSFVLKGLGDRPGLGGAGGPFIYGCNGAAGPLVYINRSGYYRIEGLAIDPKGPAGVCATSNFTGSIQLDNTGGGGVTGHQGILDHLSLTTSVAGTSISGYKAISITGANNNELITIKNSWIHCQGSPSSIGIDLEGLSSDNDVSERNDISSCFLGIKHQSGNMKMLSNMFSNNGSFLVFGANGGSIFLGGCVSGPVNIAYNEETDGGPFINSNNDTTGGGCTNGINLTGNIAGVSDISTTQYPVNIGTSGGRFVLTGNDFYVFPSTTTRSVIGSSSQSNCVFGPQGTLIDIGNFNHFPANTGGWAGCAGGPEFQSGHAQFLTNADGTAATNGAVKLIGGLSAGGILSMTGQLTSTLATGTAPLVVASTTNVANLNASSLNSATFAAPGAIGGGTPSAGAFTTLSATGQLTSTLSTGTPPLSITSTTPVANLTLSSGAQVPAINLAASGNGGVSGNLPPANGGVAVVNTVNQGRLILPAEGGFYSVATTNAISQGTANVVRALQVVLKASYTINQATWWVNASPGDTVDYGIYSIDGTTLLLHVGATVTAGTGATQTVNISGGPITLNPGSYYFAWTQTGTPSTTLMLATPAGALGNLLNAQTTKKQVQAGNSATAGVLPASLGTLTTAATGTNVPVVLFER